MKRRGPKGFVEARDDHSIAYGCAQDVLCSWGDLAVTCSTRKRGTTGAARRKLEAVIAMPLESTAGAMESVFKRLGNAGGGRLRLNSMPTHCRGTARRMPKARAGFAPAMSISCQSFKKMAGAEPLMDDGGTR